MVQVMAGIFILLFALPSYWQLIKSQGRKRGSMIIVALGVFALGFEYLALKTGWPYGGFSYGDLLAPKIGGILPLPIAIAWPPMILGVVTLAEMVTRHRLFKVVLAIVLLIWVDLIVDPGAVAVGMWKYTSVGGFYGVPVSNFAGWIVSGTIGILIVMILARQKIGAKSSLNLILICWIGVAIWYRLWMPVIVGFGFVGLYLAIISKWRK